MPAESEAPATVTVVRPKPSGGAALFEPIACGWRHRELILQLVRGEVIERHRGAILGLFWIVFQPLLYLSVFVFVFTVVRSGRAAMWEGYFDSSYGFSLAIFLGLITYWFAAECLTRGAELLRAETSFVKDMVFPLEALAWVNVFRALFYAGARLLVFAVYCFAIRGLLPWTAAYLPLVMLPLLLLMVAAGWILSAVGLYVRDLREMIGVLTTALLFLSGTFFPLEQVPEAYRNWMLLNPITFTIQQVRRVLLWGEGPDWALLGIYLLAAFVALQIGLRFFMRFRGRFAGVI